MKTCFKLSAALALILSVFAGGPAPRAQAASAMDRPVQAALVEIFPHDVYINNGAGVLINPDPRTTPAEAPLFNIAGQPLNWTWGQFSGAAAESTARREPHRTAIHIKLTGLIPNGVYSIFYETFGPDSLNPLCPTAERLVALTSAKAGQQPDASSFIVNKKGKATFQAIIRCWTPRSSISS